jgi:hypothetical protein
MEIIYYSEPFEYFLINDFLNIDQLSEVWKELDFIIDSKTLNTVPSEKIDRTALDVNNVVLAKRHSIFLNQFFVNHRLQSKIYQSVRDNFIENNLEDKFPQSTLIKYLPITNVDSTLISFYQDGDYYKPHTDSAIITAILYLWKEKDFEGGDLIFNQHDLKLTLNSNQAIIFPSCLNHEVNTIKSLNKTNNLYKRISISTFLAAWEHF